MKMKWMCQLLALLAFTSIGLGAMVENVRAQQRPRTKLVEVYYDLNAPEGGRYDVALQIKSAQNAPAVTTLSGDVGQNVSPGRNRCIVWDAGTDWPQHLVTNLVATVTAKLLDAGSSTGMVRIPGGTNSGTDPKFGSYSLTVTAFYMDRTEVSYVKWKRIYDWAIGHGYDFENAGSGKGNEHPVHTINWHDCVKWCNAKSEMEGRAPAYTVSMNDGEVYRTGRHDATCNMGGGGYRLPTSVEWEYAARGGMRGALFPWGDTISHEKANYYASSSGMSDNAEEEGTKGYHPLYNDGVEPYTAPVASFRRNGYGLYDMAGNVREWCNCPNAWNTAKVVHDGSWDSFSSYARCGSSRFIPTSYCYDDLGFRTVRRMDPIRPVSDSSDAFVADTRDNEFRIEDVTSKYCNGEYGFSGLRATFLGGVSLKQDFTVKVSGVPAGETVTSYELSSGECVGNVFEVNVGELAVGSSLSVTAVTDAGTRTKPFRINFDIASSPWNLGFTVSEKQDGRVVYSSANHSTLRLCDDAGWDFDVLGDYGRYQIREGIEFAIEMSSDTGEVTVGVTVSRNGQRPIGRKKPRKPIGKFGSVVLTAGVLGEISAVWDVGSLSWKKGSTTVGVEFGGEAKTIEFRHPAVPVVYAQAALSSDNRLSATFTDVGWQFDYKGDPTIGISGVLGAGGRWLFSVEANVSGGIVSSVSAPPVSVNELGVELSFGGTIYALGCKVPHANLNYVYPFYWIGGPKDNAKSRDATFLSSADMDATEALSLVSRDYLMRRRLNSLRLLTSESDNSGANGNEGIPVVLEKDGYPFMESSLSSAGNADGMAYLIDDAARSDINRTKLVFRTGLSNVWNAAEVVWNDGTADFNPSLKMCNDGDAIVAWVNSSVILADSSFFEDVVSSMEIAVGVRNADTGTWECRNLTTDSILDHSPVVAVDTNGDAFVAWIRNESNDYIGSNEKPSSVWFSKYSDGVWSVPAPIAQSAGLVSDLQIACKEDAATIVYTLDVDGDLGTVNDQEVYGATYDGSVWGVVAKLTDNEIADGAPFVSYREDGQPWVLWHQDGTLMVSTNGFDLATAYAVTNGMNGDLSMDCTYATGSDGRLAVVWNGLDGVGVLASDLEALVYEPNGGMWSAPITLTSSANYERGVTGAFDAGGALLAGYESVVVSTNEAGHFQYGAVDLQCVRQPFGCDLAIDVESLHFSSNSVSVGGDVDICFTVRNLDIVAVTNVSVRVCNTDSMDGIDLTQYVDLAGGEAKEMRVPWGVDDSATNLVFTIEVDGDCATGDRNRTNNRVEWVAAAPELVGRSQKSIHESRTKRLISVTVENVGFQAAESGAVVTFRRGSLDGAVLGTDTLGRLVPGETGRYNAGIAWNLTGGSFTSAYETVYIQIDSENAVEEVDEDNNVVTVQVMTALDTDGDGLLDGEEIQLGTDPTKVDTDGDGVNDYGEIFSGGTGSTSLDIVAWLDNYKELLAGVGGDYGAAAKLPAANGVNTVEQCYVAGLDPTDSAAEFKITSIEFDANGVPKISWEPARTDRAYTVTRLEWDAAQGTFVEVEETTGTSGGVVTSQARSGSEGKGAVLYRVKVALPK